MKVHPHAMEKATTSSQRHILALCSMKWIVLVLAINLLRKYKWSHHQLPSLTISIGCMLTNGPIFSDSRWMSLNLSISFHCSLINVESKLLHIHTQTSMHAWSHHTLTQILEIPFTIVTQNVLTEYLKSHRRTFNTHVENDLS